MSRLSRRSRSPRSPEERIPRKGRSLGCTPRAMAGQSTPGLREIEPDTQNPQSVYNRQFVRCSVRILLLSDIHANLEALAACVAAAPSFDLIVNLGDIVGYGASPNEVASHARELGKIFVRGNHDKAVTGLMDLGDFNLLAAAAAMWTRDELTPENVEWLRELPHGPVSVPDFPDIQLVHGSPNDEDEYVVSLGDALAPLITITMPLTFFGHTHL